ncbi:hypothetical protein HZC30_04465 [Candidatus Woesearchaeota archaeon]|nr:hypothetical protein [Candidatus Woesearchaeota archaeon]
MKPQKASGNTGKITKSKHVNKKRLLKTFGLLLGLILVVALGLFLIQQYNSKYPAEGIAGKAYSGLTSEQKQVYWACYKEKSCGVLLNESQQTKNYAAYRTCSKDCHAQALSYSSAQDYCQDSDGMDYFTTGNVTSNFYPKGKPDYCLDINGKNYLFEGVCKNNKAVFGQKNCKELGEYGCEEGRCIFSAGDNCIPLIYSGDPNKKINVVFVGAGYESLENLTSKLPEFIDENGVGMKNPEGKTFNGLLGVEPFKSNKDKFNFWYINKIAPENPDASSNKCIDNCDNKFGEKCNLPNKQVINLCNFPGQSLSTFFDSTSKGSTSFNCVTYGGWHDVSTVVHEFGHGLGGLADERHAGEKEGSPQEPNCAPGDFGTAKSWWGDMFGYGNGKTGVFDGELSCYDDGDLDSCTEEVLQEVEYFTGSPENCFITGSVEKGCFLGITKIYSSTNPPQSQEKGESDIPSSGGGPSSGLGGVLSPLYFETKSKEECLESSTNCMYEENGIIMCRDLALKKDDNSPMDDSCDNLLKRTELPKYIHQLGCGGGYDMIIPTIVSIMSGEGEVNFYGPVNERKLCENMKLITGEAGGKCKELCLGGCPDGAQCIKGECLYPISIN